MITFARCKEIFADKEIFWEVQHGVYVTCEEYASVWRFTARVCGWALPSALDWPYKKREYKSYEDAKQAFLGDLSIKTW